MSSSSPTTSMSPRRSTRLALILTGAAIMLTLLGVFALSGRSDLHGGSFEQTPAGLVYRNTGHDISFTMPPFFVRKEYRTEAADFMGKGGCSVGIMSHLVLLPMSVYEHSIEHLISRTHPGQLFTEYALWQGSVQPDIAVHTDLKQPSGRIVSQNYIHFRRGVSVISLIETLPSQTTDCSGQLAPVEKSFHLD